jgi:hypothetical protein
MTARCANVPGRAGKPVFHPPGGVYTNGLTVTITSHLATATIRYTTDGREPMTNSPAYTSPITVSSSLRLRARAFVPGQPPGEIVGAAYTLLDRDLATFSSNLPLLIINTFGGSIWEDQKQPAYLTVINTNRGRATLLSAAEAPERIGIEWRGSSSLRFPKKCYGLEIVDETTGDDRKVALLGMPADSDWVLYAPYADKTFMRDVLAFDLWEDMGHYSVRRRFVELFCDLDGRTLSASDYAGVYVLLEKIKQGKKRVNVAPLHPADTNETAITGGYLLKKDRVDYNDNPFTTRYGHTMGIEYPKAKNLVPAQRTWINRWFDEFETTLQSANFADPVNGYAKYIDVPSFIDYYWIVEIPKTIDGYSLSVFMYKHRNGKLVISPIWDRDIGFGNANYQDGDWPTGWYWEQRRSGDLWYGRLFADRDFDQRHIDRWNELRCGLFATSNLFARIDAYVALLNEAQARDFARWPRLGSYVWPNAAADWPNRTYADTVQYLKNFIRNRLAWLDRQFLPAPAFSQRGGVVPSGLRIAIGGGRVYTVYYTLNGTDPRLPGGALNPAAMEYRAPIALTGKTRIIARARKGTVWSPPAVAAFVVQPL